MRVKEIRGRCPVYCEGDEFCLADGYRLTSDKPLCMHSLAAIMPFYNAFRFAGAADMGLAGRKDGGRMYVQCPDACDYTDGGTVIFELRKSS